MPTQINPSPMLPLTVARASSAAEGIRSFDLVRPDGLDLPPFTPGSHVKVQVPNGATRKYSLCNDPGERHRYVIAVKRDERGRGGSVSLVDRGQVGDVLLTSVPENAFPLVANAAEYIFIAGGIGITPIMSMIRSLGASPTPRWQLYYFTRSPECTAFRQELSAPNISPNVQIHHDYGDPARSFDLWPVLERPSRSHVYCCGPRGLMEAVRDMTGHWSPDQVHFESFNDSTAARPEDRTFQVRLARANRTLDVPAGRTILETLHDAGVHVPSSCESGSCGTCKTRLLEGVADHRDLVLMPEELSSHIMVCVSRAQSSELVLDL